MENDIFSDFRNVVHEKREFYWDMTMDRLEYAQETFIDTLISKLNAIFETCKQIVEAELVNPDYNSEVSHFLIFSLQMFRSKIHLQLRDFLLSCTQEDLNFRRQFCLLVRKLETKTILSASWSNSSSQSQLSKLNLTEKCK